MHFLQHFLDCLWITRAGHAKCPYPGLGRRFRGDQRLAIGARSDRITIAHIPILVIQSEPTDWVICIYNNIPRNITRLRGSHKPLRLICCAHVTSPRWYIEYIYTRVVEIFLYYFASELCTVCNFILGNWWRFKSRANLSSSSLANCARPAWQSARFLRLSLFL